MLIKPRGLIHYDCEVYGMYMWKNKGVSIIILISNNINVNWFFRLYLKN